MNNKNQPIYLAIALAFGIFLGTLLTNSGSKSFLSITKNSSNEQKIKKLMNYIENDYVDSVNTDKLLDGAIAKMLEKLDPHSTYISKENLQAVTENMEGNFVGIGVQFRIINDTITVLHTIKGGPSIKAGIKDGDRILMANNDTLYSKNIDTRYVLKTLKGEPNTEVKLQVYRKMNDSIFFTSVNRNKVNLKSVDVAYMLNDSIGYIKIDRFARNTYREFKTSLDKLLKLNMTDLVLDLRGNGGGFLDIANKIADEFLEDGKLIVFTKNNKGDIYESFATSKGDFEHGSLYVLIDENSASASEIVAGALQDNDKGVIIGRRSFGKGLVQEEMDLGDGSAVRLTTARYYTPTGRSIQKPYTKKDSNEKIGNDNYQDDIQNRYTNGELFIKDSIKNIDSLKYTTPKGKVVYGGGGIVPDVFVPIDTTRYLPTFFFGRINEFAFNYVDRNRKTLSKISIDEFLNDFDKDNKILNEFITTVKISNELTLKTKKSIKTYLKNTIARDLFDDEGFYRSIESEDKMLDKVLELEQNSLLD